MSPPAPRSMWGWAAPLRMALACLTAAAAAGVVAVGQQTGGSPIAAPPLVVDVNTAPAEVLVALPKLGPTLAGRIVEARREVPFRSFDDIDARVRNIGPATIAALRPHLRIGPVAAPDLPPSPASRDGRGPLIRMDHHA